MKTIGLIGGMSWHSTTEYYRLINQGINSELGGIHSASIIIFSLDFEEIAEAQHSNNWSTLTSILTQAGLALKKAGAQFLVIGTNTMHKVADTVKEETGLPLIHIADSVGEELKNLNIGKAGLLGTRFTMEESFYRERLNNFYNIEVLIPEENDRITAHNIIYQELCHGVINKPSKEIYLGIINKLINKGAQAIVLGCTELPLLISQEDTDVPLLDTTCIHTNAIIRASLKQSISNLFYLYFIL
jgi:aspartate racemase